MKREILEMLRRLHDQRVQDASMPGSWQGTAYLAGVADGVRLALRNIEAMDEEPPDIDRLADEIAALREALGQGGER